MNKLAAHLPHVSPNHWAAGCDKCSYGYVSAPELTGACELYLERLVQAIAKELVFCECQAGVRARVYLLNRRQKLIEEARRDPRMAAQAQRLTHPDIEVAQWRVAESYIMAQPPTIHLDTETVTA